jgi:peptidoglycan/xylan/chitin deacetylase (PgdA/CDA1 family)
VASPDVASRRAVAVASRTDRALLGSGSAALVLPALGLLGPDPSGVVGTAVPAVVVALLVMGVTLRLRRRPPSALGGLIVGLAGWLFSQVRPGAIDWVLAGLIGLGVALAWPEPPRRPWLGDRVVLAAGAAAIGVLAGVAALWEPDVAWTAGAGTGLLLVAATVGRRESAGRPDRTVPVAGLVATLFVAAWIGANSPTASWFGPMISHGSRDRPEVALTFDDGPNAQATLAIAHILDSYGAKGAFFSVGKAVVARPDISRALLADGQLLGNHSYLHDQIRWLDPRYPELTRDERAIHAATGVCPAFFRPPHGQHTPFMAYAVQRNRMQMIGWDVSAGDWATSDPQLIAHRVLSRVRAGSIIDLHDGLDGEVNVDRSVLVRAMPLILSGLHARGLQVVRLDRLLGRSGYTGRC